MFQMRANIVAMGVIGAALLLPGLAQADQVGHASWYALHSRTASGEMMNPSEMTAAHRSLPFGTKVLVENLTNGRSVVVRINDRGPFVGGRIIDVSKAAASVLGMLGSGAARVKVTASGGGSPQITRSSGASVKVASASGGESAKMGNVSLNTPANAGNTSAIRSAKMEGAPASKPGKAASASRRKSAKTAQATIKPERATCRAHATSSGTRQKAKFCHRLKSS